MSVTFFLTPVNSASYPKNKILNLRKVQHEKLHIKNIPHVHEGGKYKVMIK